MDSIGNILRSERLRRGLRLDQITEWTKVPAKHLEAMEEDRFDRLPGGLLTRSFLRQYARSLDLDEEPLLAAFKEQFEPPPQLLPTPAPKYTPFRLPLLHPFGWFVVMVLFGGGVYSLWENVRRSLPESASTPGPGPPAPSQSSALRPPAPVRTPEPSVQPARKLSSLASGGVRVVFSATEPVWLSIQSDGNHLYSGTLEGQEKKELEASGKVTALIGNAGGLDVSLNGKPIGSLGEHGQVRLLELTPGGARVINRTPASGVDGSN